MSQYGPNNLHPLSTMKTELIWEGKYDEYGNRREVDIAGCAMPMQKIETIDEPRSEAAAAGQLDLFEKTSKRIDDFRNMLIWGDNKLVMASLLKDFKGEIDLIYIDPPFDVGADFTMDVPIGDEKETIYKDQSTLEMVAYNDIWGNGIDSYLHIMYERLVIMKELLSDTGSIWIHVDYRVISMIRAIMDYIFDKNSFLNEVIWSYRTAGNSPKYFARKHDNLLWYAKNPSANCTYNLIKERSYHKKLYNYGEHYKEYYDKEKDMYYSLVSPIDVWSDIYPLKSSNNERVNFITQKPEALLKKMRVSI